ncbi:hypothetical protein ACS0TY_036065 [Phlomoides rotata]
MLDIPDDLLRKILVRLPAETLLRLRSVCKPWVRIIDDPSFIKAHTHNQLNSHTLLVRNPGDPLYSFSLDSVDFINNGPQMVDAIHIKQLPGVERVWSLSYRSVCNGLILIIKEKNSIMIWNPLTKECREVKEPPLNFTPNYCFFALGYDYHADDYKVVKIDDCRTHVYSLKSDSWRKVQDYPSDFSDCYWGSTDTCFNSTFYLPPKDKIIALDLGTGSFSQLPLPGVDRSDFGTCTGFKLDALDRCLVCSLDYRKRKTFYGWVMKDNGVDKSWIKLFSLQYSNPEASLPLRLVAYLKGKEQVVLSIPCGGFLWFDIGTNSVKKFSIHGFPGFPYFKVCPVSLVRLNVRDTSIGLGDVSAKRASTRKTEETVTRYI